MSLFRKDIKLDKFSCRKVDTTEKEKRKKELMLEFKSLVNSIVLPESKNSCCIFQSEV